MSVVKEDPRHSPYKRKNYLSRSWSSIPLRVRLTALILLLSIVVIAAVIAYIGVRAGNVIEDYQVKALQDTNNSITSNINTWIQLSEQSLIELTNLPDIVSMDPMLQAQVVYEMRSAFPNLLLVHTMDLLGYDLARSDTGNLTYYGDQPWFKDVLAGRYISIQTTINPTTGNPVLDIAAPIRDAYGNIVGVASSMYELSRISQDYLSVEISGGGNVILVDLQNRVVARSSLATSVIEMTDLSNHPPVAMLRKGSRGLISYADQNGQIWRANIGVLQNGWGIIVQEPESAFLAPIRAFQGVAAVLGIAGIALMFVVAQLTIRRTLRPIETLTETATIIASGDFDRQVIVDSQDEVGNLAVAFNRMARQVKNIVGTLESRVAERTKDLEHRSNEIQAAAQIARDASTAQDVNSLINRVVRLIRDRFGYYHVGVFLIDDNGEYAVLQAASSEAGQLMLANKHKLKVGETGIVGHVAYTGEPRIALNVGADAVHFQNPFLPYTRSEMALPLKSGNSVFGILDVQSDKINAFDQNDISIFQIITDQMSVSIQRTHLVQELQENTGLMEQALRESTYRSWRASLLQGGIHSGYRYEGIHIEPLSELTQEMLSVLHTSEQIIKKGNDQANNKSVLSVPIRLRGQTLGVLNLRFQSSDVSENTLKLINEASDRIALALENARLIQNAQYLADRERLIGSISTEIQKSTDLEAVLQNTVRELGTALGVTNAFIQIGLNPSGNNPLNEQSPD
jgi:nitrate/nitrite-specific signal transduction histidine kinase